MIKRILILTATIALAIVAWQSRDIPETDDPTHPGQPHWCQNYNDPNTGYRSNCTECRRTCKPGESEDNRCKTYCRKGQCRCNHGCDSD